MEVEKNRLLIPTIAIITIPWFAVMMIGLAAMVCGKDSSEMFGSFGDSFGMLNCLFGGLAVAGVFLTYRNQEQELRLVASSAKRELTKERIKCRPVFAIRADYPATQKPIYGPSSQRFSPKDLCIFIQSVTSKVVEVTSIVRHSSGIESIVHTHELVDNKMAVHTLSNRPFVSSPNHNFEIELQYITGIGEYYKVVFSSDLVIHDYHSLEMNSEMVSLDTMPPIDITKPGIYGTPPC